MEKCSEHTIANGGIERSIKADGVVERTRRCNECKCLFKTFETTEDKIAHQRAKASNEERILRKRLANCMRMIRDINIIFKGIDGVKDEVEEWMNEDEEKEY
ncbi:hypothetical protein ES703_16762 [subsurface metagenome]